MDSPALADPVLRQLPAGRKAAESSLVSEQPVERLAGHLQLKWSSKKSTQRLVARFDQPGFKQQSKWLSVDAPADRLGEILDTFSDLTEDDVTDEFKLALLTGEPLPMPLP